MFSIGNDARVLSINNLGLLHVVARIDSSSGEGFSAVKFSLKSKQFFLLTTDLRVCGTKRFVLRKRRPGVFVFVLRKQRPGVYVFVLVFIKSRKTKSSIVDVHRALVIVILAFDMLIHFACCFLVFLRHLRFSLLALFSMQGQVWNRYPIQKSDIRII